MKIKKITEKTVKMALLLVFSLFTAFPFVWMVISALKTKTELMDMSKFFPTECQWNNFYEVIFNADIWGISFCGTKKGQCGYKNF